MAVRNQKHEGGEPELWNVEIMGMLHIVCLIQLLEQDSPDRVLVDLDPDPTNWFVWRQIRSRFYGDVTVDAEKLWHRSISQPYLVVVRRIAI